MSNDAGSAATKTMVCVVCSKTSAMWCSACKTVAYCSKECQKTAWPTHKTACTYKPKAKAAPAAAAATAADDEEDLSYVEIQHKRFRSVITKYKLDAGEKADEIASLLGNPEVLREMTSTSFAAQFGMSEEEATHFLEFVNVGVKFKEEQLTYATLPIDQLPSGGQ